MRPTPSILPHPWSAAAALALAIVASACVGPAVRLGDTLDTTPSPTTAPSAVPPSPTADPPIPVSTSARPSDDLPLTAEQAARRALWLVNPDGFPQVEFAHFVRAGDVRPGRVNIGFECCGHATTMGDATVLILVGLSSAGRVGSLRCDSSATGPLGWPESAALFDPATGALLAAGPIAFPLGHDQSSAMSALAALPTVPAPLIPATPATPASASGSRPTPTAGPTSSTPDLDRRPQAPRGEPLTRVALAPDVERTLQAWPLLPGNWWSFRYEEYARGYINGIWTGREIREEVVAAEALGSDLVVVTSRYTVRLIAPTANAIAHGYVHADDQRAPYADGIGFRVIYGDRVFDVADAAALARLVAESRDDDVLAPTASVYDPSPQLPTAARGLRVPFAMGAERLDPQVGTDWKVDERGDVMTLAGKLQGCFRERNLHLPLCHWLCDGIGIVRDEGDSASGTSLWVRRLIDYNVSTTVDDLP